MFDDPNPEYALKQAAQQITGISGEYHPPTKRKQLEQAKFELTKKLEKVNAAIAALDEHPELETFIDTLQKAGV